MARRKEVTTKVGARFVLASLAVIASATVPGCGEARKDPAEVISEQSRKDLPALPAVTIECPDGSAESTKEECRWSEGAIAAVGAAQTGR